MEANASSIILYDLVIYDSATDLGRKVLSLLALLSIVFLVLALSADAFLKSVVSSLVGFKFVRTKGTRRVTTKEP